MFATLQNDTPSLISGSIYGYEDVQYPVAGLSLRSDEELAEIAAYRVHVIQPPANFEQTGTELVWTGTRVEQHPLGRELTPEEIAARAREGMRLSFAQLLIGLVTEGWITEAEGEAWLAGTLPAPVLGLIATLPPEQQFPAKARATVPSEVLRTDPLVSALGTAQGKTAEELDQFFLTYAEV